MSDMANNPAQKRRRGRPRKDKSEKSARQAQIINAAMKLFTQKPYWDTTMSDIARAAGLDQSSLYYWFKSKEDLLGAILQESQTSMRLATRVSALQGEKPLHLYSVVYSDVIMMCELPFDYFELETVALSYPDRLETFFKTYRTLRAAIEKIILQGIEDGNFNSDNPALSVSVALSLTEGLQHQYHRALATSQNPELNVWTNRLLKSKHGAARLAADTVLGVLMEHPDVDALYQDAIDRKLIPTPTSEDGANPATDNA